MIAKTIGPDPSAVAHNRIAVYDHSRDDGRRRGFGVPSQGFQAGWREAKRAAAELSYRGAKPSRYRSSSL